MQGNNQMKKERQNDNSHSKTNIPTLGVQYLHTLTGLYNKEQGEKKLILIDSFQRY